MRQAVVAAYQSGVRRRRKRRTNPYGVGTFFDDFNRPDQNLENDANWTRVGGAAGDIVVSNNRCALPTTGSTGIYRCPDIGVADHYVEADWQSADHAAGPFIAGRLADINNFVGARWTSNDGRIYLYKRVASAFTVLASYAVDFKAGDRLRLECAGDAARVLRNGVEVIPLTSLAGANGGITFCGLVPRLIVVPVWVDNFEAGRL